MKSSKRDATMIGNNGSIVPKSYSILSDCIEEAIQAVLKNTEVQIDAQHFDALADRIHQEVMLAIDEKFHFPDLDLYG